MNEETSVQDPAASSANVINFKAAISGFAYTVSPGEAPQPANLATPISRRITRSVSRSPSSSNASRPTVHISKPRPSRTGSLSAISPPRRSPLKRPASPSTPSTTPQKRKQRQKQKHPSGYAPPSRYAHLPNNLTDALSPNLITIFIGVNPGLKTATTGHAYAHPSNLFWKLLHSSGCTPRRCSPSETYSLPLMYGLGNTNIVARATANAAELSKAEMDDGVGTLEKKVRLYRPESVVIVGKGIWEAIWRVRRGRAIRREEFRYGWQDEGERMGRVEKGNGDGDGDGEDGWEGARVFVATSTSGLAAGLRPAEKEAIWRELGVWVEKRREEKGLVGDRRLLDGVVVQGS